MNLGLLHTEIGASLGRGDALQARIPGFVRRAVQWLEQNYTFKYMERFALLEVDADADTPRYVTLPHGKVKRIQFVRRLVTEGTDKLYSYILAKEAEEIRAVSEGMPTYYWLDGVSGLVLDSTPTEDFTCEVSYVAYTAWPEDLNSSPWLVENAEQLLIDLTLFRIAVDQRDDAMMQRYSTPFKMSLDALITADVDARQGNRSEKLIYG